MSLPPPYVPEQLLLEQLSTLAASRVLCTSLGRAQFAQAAARQWPGASVYCHYLDLYRAEQARQVGDRPENLAIGCAADFPEEEVDLVAFPFSAQGEAELTRDLLQGGHQVLAMGGAMIASTDNPRDKWLHEQMLTLFDKVDRRLATGGVVYVGHKRAALKKVRRFEAVFAYRDRGRLLYAHSRPGVFAHRRVDAGARQLMNAMEVTAGSRVLDIGCGSGVLALAAACRAPAVHVEAIDSNARAIQCTQRGAELNDLTNVNAVLDASGGCERKGTYDLVLANPPYYAAFQIAELFVCAGRDALRPGGEILLVTKSPDWYRENLPRWFGEVRVEPSKDYHVVRAVRGEESVEGGRDTVDGRR